MKCDVCSKKLDPRQSHLVLADEMATIARNGFDPYTLGIAAYSGITRFLSINKQMDNGWQTRVFTDTTPWSLCENCFQRTRQFLEKADDHLLPVLDGGEGSEDARFKKTQSDNWGSFASQHCVESLTGNPPPQICFRLKALSMAEAIVKECPTAILPFLAELPELVEFQDGSGAVRFILRDWQCILRVKHIVERGPGRGKTYGERVVLTNGFVVQLPSSGQPELIQELKADGFRQATLIGENAISW